MNEHAIADREVRKLRWFVLAGVGRCARLVCNMKNIDGRWNELDLDGRSVGSFYNYGVRGNFLQRAVNMFLVAVRESVAANDRKRQKPCREPKFHSHLSSGSTLS